MKGAKSQEGYQNEYLNLSFLVFIVITILSFTLPKKWGIIVWCIGCSLLFVLLILSYIYDPKRIAQNSLKKSKKGDVYSRGPTTEDRRLKTKKETDLGLIIED